jgi:hypothetical protein
MALVVMALAVMSLVMMALVMMEAEGFTPTAPTKNVQEPMPKQYRRARSTSLRGSFRKDWTGPV